MAKSTSSARKRPVDSKTKRPVKPKWMQVIRVIMIILGSILMLLAIAAMIIQYYRLVAKH